MSAPAVPLTARPLAGRVAVVTGASSGIGEHTARLLADRGAKVALIARRADQLDAIAGDIESNGGTALALPVDVTDADALSNAADRAREGLGAPDLVFVNAGIMLPAPVSEHRTDQWTQQVDLNVTSVLSTIGVFTDDLTGAGSRGGPADLVLTSSIAAQNIYPNFAVYAATKAFVTHLGRHLRTELGPKDVRVSVLEPGIVGTELQSHVTDDGALAWLADAETSMTWLTGADIAEIVGFLAGLPAHVNLQQVTVMPTRQPS